MKLFTVLIIMLVEEHVFRLPLGFDPSTRPDFGFDFKWADHPRNRKDSTAFFLDGDAAPDRRFNYRF